jgi:hypothetical protein
MIFLICLSLALGCFYELFEFLEDLIFNPVYKNQPNLLDTDLDLVSDLIGGLLAALHWRLSSHLKALTFPFEQKNSQ